MFDQDHILYKWVKIAICGTYRLVIEVKKLTRLSSPFGMAEIVAASAGTSAVVVEAYKDARNAADSIDEMRYYEKSLDKNYEKLQDAIKKVYARKGDLLVKINRDRTKQATEECNVWMGSVKKLEKEVLALKAEYEEEKSHKFKSVRLCPRSNLSKRMVEKLLRYKVVGQRGAILELTFWLRDQQNLS
ncbi:hypothetical protein GH714_024243 [Hevea brasiliensis]|uniref:Uncharacterized protein n=1 Tax=Hevea brasiliensis TaxID=3981 RepID=A0A6A6N3X2_HEVBR|nr:hypothetical protein GH714_024243 [Hevea brasiliensis]